MTAAPHSDLPLAQPWEKAWPADLLETVVQCPVCGDGHRKLLHADLVDRTFLVAAGHWRLWQCVRCASAYLSPRPTPDSIQDAYKTYYTHQPAETKGGCATSFQALRKLRRRLSNGYTNRRYGSTLAPASRWGPAAAAAIPLLKQISDREFRHLPDAREQDSRLLDVGCGDGTFMALAHACGWQVVGIEPDPQAAKLAAARGLKIIVGDLTRLRSEAGTFDVITLSHVIEHVHEPIAMLQSCHRLLKPGGQIWIETPNIESVGHRVFGEHWRGLEAPRHLTLFNRRSLGLALQSAGFATIRELRIPSPRRWLFESSLAMAKGQPQHGAAPGLPLGLRLKSHLSNLVDAFQPGRREFLTVLATKAG